MTRTPDAACSARFPSIRRPNAARRTEAIAPAIEARRHSSARAAGRVRVNAIGIAPHVTGF
ncbi:hypothetical protein AQ477_19735 [Burkholderia thailandensis]|nr:hypothetical protein AQ477_19735 [Burkholderia thailandensis]KXF57969.1 hypothetical protein AQ476_24835 [Burkholderia thailandensis]PNE77275.1 hypothetical protein A8H37_02585 [Burkholderia thailandensis]